MRLAFFGPPGCGKTSLANIMAAKSGGVKLSFADELRNEYSVLGQVPLRELTTAPQKYAHRTGLQQHGSQRRAQDDMYWVRFVEDRIRAFDTGSPNPPPLFVDDARYDNEFEMLKFYGFIVIRLEGNPDGDAITEDEQGHESEVDWKEWQADWTLGWMDGLDERAGLLERFFSDNG